MLVAAAVAGRASGAGASEALLARKIPSSGEEIPIIGLGTSGPFEVGESPAQRAPLKEVLEAFFAAGARLIDTSPMYSTAERVLGDLLTPAMHERAFLATKVWTNGERAGIEQMRRSGQRSEEHTSELQSLRHLVCRLLLEKKKTPLTT